MQNLIFYIIHEKLEKLAGDKSSSFLGPLASFEENKVL
jgi:hypothetical protein